MHQQDLHGRIRTAAISIEHAAVAGRLRLRCASLKSETEQAKSLAEALRSALHEHSVEVRHRTGSVIIRFDPAVPHATVVAAAVAALEPEPVRNERSAAAEIRIESLFPFAPPLRPSRPSPTYEPCPTADWHRLTLDSVVEALNLTSLDGLSEQEWRVRIARFGPNTLADQSTPSPLRLLVKQFDNAPVKMLAASAFVSLVTGGVLDAVATLSIVAVNGVLGFLTESQAETTIRRLTATSGDTARVVRDGTARDVRVSEVVPGDRILLQPGTQIAADARIVAYSDLLIDESTLTGESVPVEKNARRLRSRRRPIAERANMAYAGTLVASGTGEAVVVATGSATQAAQTQTLSETADRPQAPVEANLEVLGVRLVKYSLVACGVFFALGALRGYPLSVLLKDALALAVASVPEGLPAVATTTLALGLRRMERRGILIRRLDVLESLGAIQTICLDKTGTLTSNRMVVDVAVAGDFEWRRDRFSVVDDASFRTLAEIAALNNDADPSAAPASPGASSPTEQALIDFARAAGVDVLALRHRYPRIATRGRDARRRFMTTVHRQDDGEQTVLVKGAPADVLARCRWKLGASGRDELSDADRTLILARNDALAARPARVLAFAQGQFAGGATGDPQGLTWVGLIAMIDPIRPGASEFVKAMHTAGIDTVLITGDQAATAEAVARELDLSNGTPLQTIDSTHIEDLDPALLAGIARTTHVFARVNPRQKLNIVRALQSSGRVVAMTGDGVNDGPALKAAHVGVAMGESGANLARDVANVVIRDDRLPTLIEAVAQGRAISRNIRRALEFLVTTNLSEIAVEMVEAVHGPGELETPMELLWINLASDVAPGLGLALADPDFDVMTQPPRPPDEAMIPKQDYRRMAGDTAIIALAALASHFVGLARHGPGPETRGMTFLTLSLGQLLYTLGCQRTDPRHLGRLFENRTLDLAVGASVAFTALPFLIRPLGRTLGVAPLVRRDLSVAITASAVPLIRKLIVRGVEFASAETIEVPCKTSS